LSNYLAHFAPFLSPAVITLGAIFDALAAGIRGNNMLLVAMT
jgi:hypothetical protein